MGIENFPSQSQRDSTDELIANGAEKIKDQADGTERLNVTEDQINDARKEMEEVQTKETKIERIPTAEEIESVFEKLIGIGRVFAVGCKEKDEKGVYKYDIRIPGDLPEETTWYEYTRKGEYKEGSSLSSVIDVVYYEKDTNGQDMAVGGTSVANWINGSWEIINS
jgi:hypothetical protein